ncbi:unnamed protein product [Albugo candida]|uniref:THH1/TOM1/TOM3 domain-containing protein n=1 Tax=Albugo candida TaxID=65357 RepID=A0A024FZ54_9STRA|nr:unnamed protein product [Albugo candida]|eukprot:CCI39588.1 unnamed protein product [Albugo candida]
MASYFLALCYMFLTVITVTKYMELRRVLRRYQFTGWNTVQLLIWSIALGAFFRMTTFSTLCIFDYSQRSIRPYPYVIVGVPPYNPTQHDNNNAVESDAKELVSASETELNFYNKVVAVLFNLPDYLFVSSYLLVVLVWAESFQSSRHHWFSAEQFRRKWMIFYLVFNGALYLAQVFLYMMLFLFDSNGIFRDSSERRLRVIPEMIFYVVAATDLLLPIIISTTWLYLTLSLSGFPFRSSSTKFRLKRVGRLAMIWSLGRILYSVMTLLTFTRGWFDVNHGKETVQLALN